MVKVYLLRHGETTWNSDNNRYCGRTDIALSKIGIKQAEKACEALKGVEFSHAYASTLDRAVITAEIITKHELPVHKDERLVEVDFGEWEGVHKETFIEEDPETWNHWFNDPGNHRAGKTGEHAKEVFQRAKAFYDELVMKHSKDETILVTAHNTLNRIFIAGMLEMPLRNYRSIHQFNTAITIFTLERDAPIQFLEINNHEHLK